MSGASPTLTALVLAGGAARRMGRAKAQLDLRGRTLLDRALDLAGTVAPEVLLLPGRRLVSPTQVRTVPDWPRAEGPLAGLGAGLEAAAHPWCLALPCDMPFVTEAIIETLRLAIPAQGRPVVAVLTDRGPEPFVALYHRDLVAPLRRFLDEGGRSMRAFLSRCRVHEVAADALRAADPELAFLHNVNTPADLAAARSA